MSCASWRARISRTSRRRMDSPLLRNCQRQQRVKFRNMSCAEGRQSRSSSIEVRSKIRMRSTNGHRRTLNVCFGFLCTCALAWAIVLPAFGELNQGTKSVSRISLQPCEVSGAQAEVKQKALCGTYEVFEDRVAKRGRTIAIKILVFPATGQYKATDPLFYIPGGPGSSATEDAPYVAQELAAIRDHRDFVFVDQRGTGGSNPLNCEFFNESDLRSYLGYYFPLDNVLKCRGQLEPGADLRLYTTTIAM